MKFEPSGVAQLSDRPRFDGRIAQRCRTSIIKFHEISILLGVQLCFRRFFPKFKALL